MTAIPSADKNTLFVEAGSISLRNPDGTFQPAKPLFLAVDAADVTSASITRSECELCEDIGRTLASKFAVYMDGVKAIERLQRKGRNR